MNFFVKKALERSIRKRKRNGLVHKFYHLKLLITLEQVNASIIEKKKDPYEQKVR